MNGVARRDAELAVLPLGTGQDFGRTYGIPTRFDDAVRVALDGRPRTIDPGRVALPHVGRREAERWFANVGSVGMSGAVAQRANSMSKALGGRATFFYALTREFVAWENTEVTVTLDGGERRGRMHDVIVANGLWHGGGMKLAPDARPDDGLFDVVLIGDVAKLDFVTTAPKLYKGGHVPPPEGRGAAQRTVASRRRRAAADRARGRAGRDDARAFEIVPGALRLRVPAARRRGRLRSRRRRRVLRRCLRASPTRFSSCASRFSSASSPGPARRGRRPGPSLHRALQHTASRSGSAAALPSTSSPSEVRRSIVLFAMSSFLRLARTTDHTLSWSRPFGSTVLRLEPAATIAAAGRLAPYPFDT